MSEEALEHRNKEFKNYRERFARKTSRTDNLKDIFHRFLYTSDPYISSLRTKKINRRKSDLPDEVQKLLSESYANDSDEE